MSKDAGKKTKFISWPQKINRFKKNEDGATAVEFGMLAGPFFLLLFAVIETSIYFYAGQAMESGVDNVARLIRTGQLDNNSSQQEFKDAVCNEISTLFNCADLRLKLEVVAEFDDLVKPDDPTDFNDVTDEWMPPAPDKIAMITVMYEWPIVSNYVASSLSSLSSGDALLSTVAVFKTEPWPES